MKTLERPTGHADRLAELAEHANHIRRNIVEMVAAANSGHPGGSLSGVELLVGLYFGQLRHDPTRPDWPDRDRLLLSKGHASPLLYAVLTEAGYFSAEELPTFRCFGSRLQGHPSLGFRLPGVEIPGGSLGHGLGMGVGMALANRLAGRTSRVYVLLGDGEVQEGSIWEAAQAAAHYRLHGLTAIVDANGVQQDGLVAEVMGIEPLADRWAAFGWAVREIDGHDQAAVLAAYDWAIDQHGRPSVIVARTVKGKGISFMEGRPEWHGKAPQGDLLARARAELAGGR
ncbi:MAG: transketolase [Chloroflexi bacterium]|nr:transketolase [Chloroflexota bacterium]